MSKIEYNKQQIKVIKPGDPMVVTKDTPFMICLESFPKLPKDCNGNPLFLGDTIKLFHNGRVGKIRVMQYVEEDIWIIGIEGGSGCFSLPESSFNVLKIAGKVH